ncbi:MAG TPA: glycosyl hydrolase, partial [Solirubrobacteraceae bacterium]
NAWHLKRLDAVVAMAEARDIKLLLMFADAPCWASSAPESLKQGCSGKWWERGVQRYLPTRPADYGDALAYLARRYGTRVAAWEMWNEPNHETFNPGPDKARRYAALVRAAYPKAKAAAPGVKFLAGALSTADFKFTEELFANGMGSSFDAFSVHPYANDKSPLDPGSDDWVNTSFVRGIPAVRRALVRRGIYKPIWLTEFGWSTTRVRDAAPYRNGVDADVQARYIGQALAQARKWSYVPVAIYYNLRDRAVDSTSRTDHFGLTRVDGTPKPALAAFRAAATGASASRKARRARAARRRARAARAAHRTVR